MKLALISEGIERAEAIRDDIRSGRHSFRYLAKKYGVSIPYISAVARRIGKGRGAPVTAASPVPGSGLRPTPFLTTLPSLGIKNGF